MGRLQKKKTSNKSKKKKQSDISRSEATAQTATAQNKVILAVPAQKEAPKRTAIVPKLITDDNLIGKSIQFLREVKVELKKVTWPSRKQTMGSTLVVIILVMIISLFLGVVDIGLSGIIRVVFQ